MPSSEPYPLLAAFSSIGSPSAVPVPCDSCKQSRCPPASCAAARPRSAACADPLGAVRLALRPSCAMEEKATRLAASPPEPRTSEPTPSDRTYPLARRSKVRQRPSAESMPALAYATEMDGVSTKLTAVTSATLAPSSACWLSTAACSADKEDEQAVSMVMHAPCRPSVKESRPAATAVEAPVAAYTLCLGISSRKSTLLVARYTSVSLPRRPARRRPAACNAASPLSSRIRCCGSMLDASEMEMPNAALSKYSAPAMKPPCRRQAARPESSSSASGSHRAGTEPIASKPAASFGAKEGTP
mmetsp:Transcript_32911/g.106294  ORF Transcript_32911/g.106294 Transcript_32911/m.106294 type:complete len:301 (-) Transcript_32911:466-1368(-)